MHRNFLLSSILAIPYVTAALRSGKHCFGGCDLTLNYIDFNDTEPGLSKKIRSCRSVLHATSVYLCYDVYCEEDGREQWLRGLNETCEKTVGESMPGWSVVEGLTDEDIERVRRLRADEASWQRRPPPFGEVALPDEVFFDRAFMTLTYAWFEVDAHWAYGYVRWFCKKVSSANSLSVWLCSGSGESLLLLASAGGWLAPSKRSRSVVGKLCRTMTLTSRARIQRSAGALAYYMLS